MATPIQEFKDFIARRAEDARHLIDVPNGEVSDGYHTFNELYEHRINLFIALGTTLKKNYINIEVWKSMVHSDGSDVWDGWFIAGINWNGEQITYHLPIKKWDWCGQFDELDIAPFWDGHTPKDVERRLLELSAYISSNI